VAPRASAYFVQPRGLQRSPRRRPSAIGRTMTRARWRTAVSTVSARARDDATKEVVRRSWRC
jgi:hypothetical protein